MIIVGGGAVGVGCALMLTRTFGLETSRVLLIERGEGVGDTFRRWPAEMRFISPSFNQQGWTSSFDLNSIAYGTSPAFSLHTEHPSGEEYADYLDALAGAARLRVRTLTEVVSVEAIGAKGGTPSFSVGVQEANPFMSSKPGSKGKASRKQARDIEKLSTRYVVWAAGEFQYPRESPGTIIGTELCLHNSRVRSWAKLPGDEFVLIGGCVLLGRQTSHARPASNGSLCRTQCYAHQAPSSFSVALALISAASLQPAGMRAASMRPST